MIADEALASIDGAFIETFRGLLLPIPRAAEARAIQVAFGTLSNAQIDPSDRAAWLRLEQQRWRESDAPSNNLRELVIESIASSGDELAVSISTRYFDAHRTLRRSHFDLSFEAVTALMSHSRMALELASVEVMSASQIANLLSARQGSYRFPWNTVQALLRHLGTSPSVSEGNLASLWSDDEAREIEDFADADWVTSAELVAEVARRLGFPGEISPFLDRLYGGSGQFVGPFLQILHYQAALMEFYDHPPTWAYEFAPRGAAAQSIFKRYPDFMGISGNPILNNAKAASRLDEPWALSRDERQRPAALALARLLLGLEQMAYSAGRELAGWFRRWLIRVIRLEGVSAGPRTLLELPSGNDIGVFLRGVAGSPTRTFGILEQRLLDVVASLTHSSSWLPRGLGDSVNATNVSRRKLGDCDFQNAADRAVVAYESHGGTLSAIYVDEHLRTVAKTLPFRREEWGDEQWALEIVFVCHGTKGIADAGELDEGGTSITWRTVTFELLVNEILANASQQEIEVVTQTRFVDPLNLARTPREVLAVAQRFLP